MTLDIIEEEELCAIYEMIYDEQYYKKEKRDESVENIDNELSLELLDLSE